MKHFQTEIDIAAPPGDVWAVLTDATSYTTWDPNMIELRGHIAPGEELHVVTKLSPGRAFTPTVTEFEPNRRMVWASGMPLGLFKGTRTFTLSETDGGTHFKMEEVFEGPMMALIGGTIPDMTKPFQDFAAGLKAHTESR